MKNLILGMITLATFQTNAQTSQVERRTVDAANYKVDRALDSYQGTLNGEFISSLKELSANDIWIDSGAGDALAIVDYLKGGGAAKVIAIDARAPKNINTLAGIKLYADQFKYLTGRYIQEYKSSELPRAKLITDVLGATAYGSQIDEVLQVLLSSLAEGGKLYFQIDEGTVPNSVPSDVEHANNVLFRFQNGKKIPIPFADFYNQITGVKFHSGPSGDGGHESGVFVRGKGPVIVPKLKLELYLQDTPPQRFYLWQ